MSLESINKSFLFVDDNSEIGKAIVRLANSANVSVQIATNAETAISIIEQNPDRFFLVLTDQSMPGMSGVDFLGITYKRWPHIERALISGNDNRSFLKESYSKGQIFRYLDKPVEPKEIQKLLIDASDNFMKEADDLRSVIPDRSEILAISLAKVNAEYKQKYLPNLEEDYLQFCQQIWNRSELVRYSVNAISTEEFQGYMKRRIYDSVKSILNIMDTCKPDDDCSFKLSSAFNQFNYHVPKRVNRYLDLNESMFTALLTRLNEYYKMLSLNIKEQIGVNQSSIKICLGSPFCYNDIYNPSLENVNNGLKLATLNFEIYMLICCMNIEVVHTPEFWPEFLLKDI